MPVPPDVRRNAFVTQPGDGRPIYVLGNEVDGREICARAGDTVFAPRGSRHTFQNIGSVPGRTLTTVVPGGVDLFFEELESAAPRVPLLTQPKSCQSSRSTDKNCSGPRSAARSVRTTSHAINRPR
jgi:hypothetical protein